MGFFNKLKQKAQDALNQPEQAPAAPEAAPQPPRTPAPQAQAPRPSGPTFEWDGDTYPLPEGWSGLSMDDWFLKLESVRDQLMHADEVDLEPMVDEDGDELDPEEVLLIKEYGFRSGGHWEAFRSWGVMRWADESGENPGDLEFRMSSIAREKLMAQKADAMRGQGRQGGALDPVEGVSVEQWAGIQAAVAGGSDVDALIAQAGIDRARWDRVSQEWTARMSTDTTATIPTVYGNAFAGAQQGQYGAQAAHAAAAGVAGDLSDEPVPFERFVEIQEAMGAAADAGQDPNALLASFGISALDWSNIGMFWNKKLAQEATKYHALFTEYSAKYSAKYRGA